MEFDTDGDGQVEQSVSYAYDGSGPRTKLALPDGKTVEYQYDVNGRLVRAVDWDLAGRLVGVERSNAFESYYRNDAGGQLRSLKHVYRGDVVAQFDYAVDARGNRTQVTETILQPDASTDVHTIDYTYDALSRLLQAQYADGGGVFRQYDYEYDLAGNRTKRVETIGGSPTTTNYTYNAANQLTSDGVNTLTYDDNGNLTGDETNSYTWDRANRLLSMGGSSYAYDGVGRRVSQTVSSIVTEYLLDVQPSLAVVLAASTPGETTRFVHGPRGLERQQGDSGAWLFPMVDGLGSVRGMLDNDWPDSDVQGTRQYAPYGVPFGAEGTVDTPFGFTSEQVDSNDLVYLRARYLNPTLGVFVQLDPFAGIPQRPGSLNRYSYVSGNPSNRTDSAGLQSEIDVHEGEGAWCECYLAFNVPVQRVEIYPMFEVLVPEGLKYQPVDQLDAVIEGLDYPLYFACIAGFIDPRYYDVEPDPLFEDYRAEAERLATLVEQALRDRQRAGGESPYDHFLPFDRILGWIDKNQLEIMSIANLYDIPPELLAGTLASEMIYDYNYTDAYSDALFKIGQGGDMVREAPGFANVHTATYNRYCGEASRYVSRKMDLCIDICDMNYAQSLEDHDMIQAAAVVLHSLVMRYRHGNVLTSEQMALIWGAYRAGEESYFDPDNPNVGLSNWLERGYSLGGNGILALPVMEFMTEYISIESRWIWSR